MSRRTLSVVLACVFGAVLGSFIAMDINQRFEPGHYFAWVGALVGGLTAYCAVDFKQFLHGIAQAYTHVVAWKPNRSYWKLMGLSQVFTASLLFPPAFAFLLSTNKVEEGRWTTSVAVWVVPSIVSIAAGLFFGSMNGARMGLHNDDQYQTQLQDMIVFTKKAIRHGNILSLIWYALLGICWIIVQSVKRVPRGVGSAWVGTCLAVRKSGTFCVTAFRFVHSKRRTICLIAATAGAAIGYHFGSAVIGGIAGGLIGLIEHELVSVKWLKIMPNGHHAA